MAHTSPIATDQPTVQRPQNRRDDILRAAATRFLSQGFAGTSLRDIAADCGIKAGSIYYHFASKDDLLIEVLVEGVEAMNTAFDRTLAETARRPPAERIHAHVSAHLSELFEGGPVTAAHVSAFRTLPVAARRAAMPIRDAYEARWTELFDDLLDDGHLDPELDLGFMRLTLIGAMNFATQWYDPDRGNLDRLATTIARQFWEGVATETARSRPAPAGPAPTATALATQTAPTDPARSTSR